MRIAVSRAPGAERVVTPLELFFDLVYVFAIGQLSHHLLEHVDLRTGAETVIMALAVVHAWYMTAWGANWLDPGRLPVRVLLVGLMFASLLMSVGIADAFDDRAWLFVTGYLLLQLGRAGFLIVALRGRPLGEHFVNDMVWELAIGVLWVAGAIADGDARLVLWGLAAVAAHGGAWALHWLPGRGRAIDLGHTEIAGEHLFERFRLFFIIALGETVLTTGSAFTSEPFALERLVALAVAFTGTVALWWGYFQREEGAHAAMEEAEDAGRRRLVGHVDADDDGARADRDRRRRRDGDRPPRRRGDARLHDPGLRRAGALPARPMDLPSRGAGVARRGRWCWAWRRWRSWPSPPPSSRSSRASRRPRRCWSAWRSRRRCEPKPTSARTAWQCRTKPRDRTCWTTRTRSGFGRPGAGRSCRSRFPSRGRATSWSARCGPASAAAPRRWSSAAACRRARRSRKGTSRGRSSTAT